MGHEVFVSYSQADRECAFELVAQLEARGIGTWIAPRDITPATDWAAEIVTAISSARLMVLVFSARCNSSPQVCREVERAVHREVPVLPLRIEAALPTRSLEYFLSTQHWFDAFPPPREQYYERLLTHIQSMLEQPPRTAAAGAAPTTVPSTELPADLATGLPSGRTSDRGSGLVNNASTGSRRALVIAPPELEALERRLAYHIGPVARLLVQRALHEAGGREELTNLLANEIESPVARQRFVESCRTGAVH
jgi:hypothetical protein